MYSGGVKETSGVKWVNVAGQITLNNFFFWCISAFTSQNNNLRKLTGKMHLQTPGLSKSMNMNIYVVGTSDQIFIKDYYTATIFLENNVPIYTNI